MKIFIKCWCICNVTTIHVQLVQAEIMVKVNICPIFSLFNFVCNIFCSLWGFYMTDQKFYVQGKVV